MSLLAAKAILFILLLTFVVTIAASHTASTGTGAVTTGPMLGELLVNTNVEDVRFGCVIISRLLTF